MKSIILTSLPNSSKFNKIRIQCLWICLSDFSMHN